MKTYCLAMRAGLHYRREVFESGLRAVGLTEAPSDRCDVFVTWNRYGHTATIANQVESRGGTVLVAENAIWGNAFAGDRWYSIARRFHNTAGAFPIGGNERWDSLGLELQDWRPEGGEVVGLMQRGIGPAGVAMPPGWRPKGCDRIRKHPGVNPCVPLDEDLARASLVRTWGSGAAVKALMWGIRVEADYPNWIARQNNTTDGRLAAFRTLAHAQWRLSEISDGSAFAALLD